MHRATDDRFGAGQGQDLASARSPPPAPTGSRVPAPGLPVVPRLRRIAGSSGGHPLSSPFCACAPTRRKKRDLAAIGRCRVWRDPDSNGGHHDFQSWARVIQLRRICCNQRVHSSGRPLAESRKLRSLLSIWELELVSVPNQPNRPVQAASATLPAVGPPRTATVRPERAPRLSTPKRGRRRRAGHRGRERPGWRRRAADRAGARA